MASNKPVSAEQVVLGIGSFAGEVSPLCTLQLNQNVKALRF